MAQKDRLSKIKMTKTTPEFESSLNFTGEVAEYAGERGPDVVIGGTVYDLQSNSSFMQRTYMFPDGSISAVWTRGTTPTSYPERGTGYNYYDGSAWGPAPSARIEPVRCGWPNIAPYMENGEIVCAHTGGAAGLIFSYRENKGTGDWTNFYLVGPEGHEDILWPRMITTGENNEIIHVICITPPVANGGTVYEGLDGALLYSRSDDGGVTWNPENMVLDGVSSTYTNGWSGDVYTWAASNDETIAFVAWGGIKDGVVMKSTDAGDSWERIPFYNSGVPFFDNTQDVLTIFGGGDGYNAGVVDENGKVHVAFGRQLHACAGDGTSSYYPYSNGLGYWNEDMAPLDSLKVGSDILDPIWMRDNGYLLAEVQENGDDTIIGVATYQASLTSFPQLMEKDGQIYAFYSALSLGFDNTVNNYRHVWGRVSENDGLWSEYTDYTGDVFHLFSECVFPGVSPTADESIHLTYQTSNQPGIAERYADHDPIDNNMVYLKVTPLHVGVGNNLAEAAFAVQSYPNPAVDQATIMVTTETTGQIKLTVSNVLGQQIYTASKEGNTLGAHAFTVNVSDFDAGIYLYTVEIGNQKVTNKMLVK
ncbi:T9SS type A sorting domain-containing protein [Thiomicrospira sp.]|uniref:T9SS type A sorting domain-containing protein n=1 Tax=Thiomicrospira sp. TaxID=935 RepID=UPI002F931CA3